MQGLWRDGHMEGEGTYTHEDGTTIAGTKSPFFFMLGP